VDSLTTSQVLFLIVLGIIALGIMAFAGYVLSTSMWGATERWQERRSSRRT